MDVLQLSHAGSVRTLCRLIQGMDRPVVVADGTDEVMVVLSPSAFEGVLLRGGRGGRAGRSAFGSGCAPEGRAEDACGCGTGRLSE
ncbi:hypothetical protein GPA_01240 [Gordonibacter pamelaeae 7-10-1-b]|uniref:Uncharacterized protein n=2 Tax=Gordonibacter pamelaeae TaxID=471189 RepID=D6E6E5_9ACTN|nr:hypothetical protein GPA_01240 [Gordonibacter pamelaeae 7-10-1-b]